RRGCGGRFGRRLGGQGGACRFGGLLGSPLGGALGGPLLGPGGGGLLALLGPLFVPAGGAQAVGAVGGAGCAAVGAAPRGDARGAARSAARCWARAAAAAWLFLVRCWTRQVAHRPSVLSVGMGLPQSVHTRLEKRRTLTGPRLVSWRSFIPSMALWLQLDTH